MKDPIAAIDRLKELPSGWDTYDGAAIDLTAREHAKSFVYDAAKVMGAAFWNPKVGPTADGGVALLWKKPGVPTKAEALFSSRGDRFVVFQSRKILEKGPIKGPDFLLRYFLA